MGHYSLSFSVSLCFSLLIYPNIFFAYYYPSCRMSLFICICPSVSYWSFLSQFLSLLFLARIVRLPLNIIFSVSVLINRMFFLTSNKCLFLLFSTINSSSFVRFLLFVILTSYSNFMTDQTLWLMVLIACKKDLCRCKLSALLSY